jgi:anti-sigma factor (TIGR02949 family)
VNCREFVDFLMAFLDDELPREQRDVFRSHMDACPSCETYLDTYRETVRLGQSVCRDPEGPVPEDVPERLVQAILAARARGD